VERDHHAVVQLSDFDSALIERTARVAAREIQLEDSARPPEARG